VSEPAKKILIVEDDPDHVKALTLRLRAAGYDLLTARDGMQAVAVARREKPDVIILDLGLPGGDGYQVLRRLKVLGPLASIPVIVLSARDPAVHREKSLEAGAIAFFQKPPDSDVLLELIRQSTA